MFTVSGIVGIPHFVRWQVFAQIINVPVASAGTFAVMPDPGFYTSRTEGAAHVNIIAGLEVEGTEFSDDKPFCSFGPENQCICSGERVHEGESMMNDEG